MKKGKNVPHVDTTEVVLIHCKVVNSNYHQASRVFYTFVRKKLFGQFFDILPKNVIFLKNFDFEFSYIEVWFTKYGLSMVY